MYAGKIVERGSAQQVLTDPEHPYTLALLDAIPPRGDLESRVAADARRLAAGDQRASIRVCFPSALSGGGDEALRRGGTGAATARRRSARGGVPLPARRRQIRGATVERYPVIHRQPPPGGRGGAVARGRRPATGVPRGARRTGGSTHHRRRRRRQLRDRAGRDPWHRRRVGEREVDCRPLRPATIEPTSGRVVFGGRDLSRVSRREMRAMRRRMQMVFQDPRASLDRPASGRGHRGRAAQDLPPLGRAGSDKRYLDELIQLVGLTPTDLKKFPNEFSGGQLQRIAIARALALTPELLICDEVVSSLDASISAQIINLLADLRRELGLTYLFISHDLALVRYFCDRIAVMQSGRIVELATSDAIFGSPAHATRGNCSTRADARSRASRPMSLRSARRRWRPSRTLEPRPSSSVQRSS